MACLDGDLGDWNRAAVLHGAAQDLLDQTGVPWDTLTARYRQDSLDQTAAALGDEQFQRAYTRGTALTFNQAIDIALGRVLPGPPGHITDFRVPLNRRATTIHERGIVSDQALAIHRRSSRSAIGTGQSPGREIRR